MTLFALPSFAAIKAAICLCKSISSFCVAVVAACTMSFADCYFRLLFISTSFTMSSILVCISCCMRCTCSSIVERYSLQVTTKLLELLGDVFWYISMQTLGACTAVILAMWNRKTAGKELATKTSSWPASRASSPVRRPSQDLTWIPSARTAPSDKHGKFEAEAASDNPHSDETTSTAYKRLLGTWMDKNQEFVEDGQSS